MEMSGNPMSILLLPITGRGPSPAQIPNAKGQFLSTGKLGYETNPRDMWH